MRKHAHIFQRVFYCVIISTVLLLLPGLLAAQENKPAFWYDIQAFKKNDSMQMPASNQVLFVGSSSFTMWKDVQDYFPGIPIINRGFGGSTLPDLIRYANDVILPYQPKQVVIYCGENDVASSSEITADTVLQRFKTLFTIIRNKYPNVFITFVSLKPSPSRTQFLPTMLETNLAIRKYLKKKKKTSFVDVYHPMLRDDKPMEELFLTDRLHMNPQGYKIWQTLIEPHLLK